MESCLLVGDKYVCCVHFRKKALNTEPKGEKKFGKLYLAEILYYVSNSLDVCEDYFFVIFS